MKPEKIKIRKILTLAGTTTFEVELDFKNTKVFASSPVGTSVGTYEVQSFPGGIEKCEKNYKDIMDNIKKFDVEEQVELDEFLKSNINSIGGAASLATSIAMLRANAMLNGKEIYEIMGLKPSLPRLITNIIGGGAHALNSTDIQEFLVIDTKAKSFAESFEKNQEVYNIVKEKLAGKISGVNIEFAMTAKMKTEQVLNMLSKIASRLDLDVGMDVAANSLWNGKYYIYKTDKLKLSREKQIKRIINLVKEYDIRYLEDPLNEEDLQGFRVIKNYARRALIVGDDLLATNIDRLQKSKDCIEASIVKPNQAGNVTDTIKYIVKCKDYKISQVISHRSQEVIDDFIAHLSVGTNAPIIKASLNRADKINTLLRIEDSIF